MSELTRSEKVTKLFHCTHLTGLNSLEIACLTDKEINDLYDKHFNKVTQEDFEGFKKVCDKFRVMVFGENDLDNKKPLYIDQIKKELGL